MKILVAGGAGFIGSHLVDRLLEQGHQVMVVDLRGVDAAANLHHRAGTAELRVVGHDISMPLPADARRFEPDRIYNLVCDSGPFQRDHDPVHSVMTRVSGARHLLELARVCGARYLQGSSSGVYGDPAVHPQPETYHGNVDATGPRAAHDEAQRCAETLSASYHAQHGVDVRIARIFSTYGPRMGEDGARVISSFVTQALRGDDLTVHGDGTKSRAFCYVDDIVDGLVALMESDIHTPVNLGHSEEMTLLQLAERVLRLTGSQSRLSHGALRAGDVHSRRADISLAEKALGWRPRVPLQVGLQSTVEFFRQQAGSAIHA